MVLALEGELWIVQNFKMNEMIQSNFYNNTSIIGSHEFPALTIKNTIMSMLDRDDMLVVHHLLSEDHNCITGEQCNNFKRDSREVKNGMSYHEYLLSENMWKEYVTSLARRENVRSELIAVRHECSYEWLARLLGLKFEEIRMTSGLLFWRMFKRLYYTHYGNIVPVCIWKSVADILRKNSRHPAITEDLLVNFWNYMHPRAMLRSPRLFVNHHLFTFDGEWEAKVCNGKTYIKARKNVVKKVQVTPGRRKMVPVMMPISEWNELADNTPHMMGFFGTVTKAHVEASAKNLEDASKEMKDSACDFKQFVEEARNIGLEGMEQLLQASSEFPRIAEQLQHVIDDMAGEMYGHMRGTTDTLVNNINTIGQRVEAGTTGVFRLVGSRMLVVLEAFCLYFLEEYLPKPVWWCFLVLAIVRWFSLTQYLQYATTVIIPKIMEWFSGTRPVEIVAPEQFMEGDGDNTPHSSDTLYEIITAGISVILGKVMYNGTPGKTKIEKITRMCAGIFSVKKGMESVPSLFEWLRHLVDTVAVVLGAGESDVLTNMKELHIDMATYEFYVKEVSRLYTNETRERLNGDVGMQNFILKLRDEGDVYMRRFQQKEWPSYFRSTFNQVWRMITELATCAEKAKNFDNFRIDPYCVWVFGGVGVGKSNLCDELSLEYTKALGEPMNNCMYARGGSDHWDRYGKQTCVYMDDAFQVRGNIIESRLQEFISMRSNDGYILPMAALEDKGMPFMSKVIICSSNVAYPTVNTLVTTPEAVLRRRHLVVEAVIDEDFVDPVSKLPNAMKIAQVNFAEGNVKTFPHLKFNLWPSLSSSEPTVRGLTWDELKRKTVEDCVAHIDIQKKLVQNRRERIDEYIREQGGRDWAAMKQKMTVDLTSDGKINEAHAGRTYSIPLGMLPNEWHDVLKESPYYHEDTDKIDLDDEDVRILTMFKIINGALIENVPVGVVLTAEMFDHAVRVVGFLTTAGFEMLSTFVMGGITGQNHQTVDHEVQRLWNRSKELLGLSTGCTQVDEGLKSMKAHIEASWNRVKQRIPQEWLNTIKDNLRTFALMAGGVVVAIGMWKSFAKASVDDTMNLPNVESSGDPSTRRQARVKTVKIADNRPFSGVDKNAQDLIDHKLMKHLYIVEVGRLHTYGLAIHGQNLLVPFHLVAHHTDDEGMYLTCLDGSVSIHCAFSNSQVVRIGDEDMALIKGISRLPPGPRFEHHFLKEKDLDVVRKANVMTVSCNRLTNQVVISRGEAESLNEKRVKTHGCDAERYFVRTGWTHNIPMKVGDCMLPLVAEGVRFPRKLIGFHISGGPQGYVALCPVQEQFEGLFNDDVDNDCHAAYVEKEVEIWNAGEIDEGYKLYGMVNKHRGEYTPMKTKIRKTPLFDVIREHTTEPAVLSKSDPRTDKDGSPFESALKKYGIRTRAFSPTDQRMAYEYCKADVINHFKTGSHVGVLTEHQILNGEPLLENYKAMEMSTSPGWPWKLMREGESRGKEPWLNGEPGNWELKPEMRSRVKQCLLDLRRGVRPEWVWAHCLKDERRSLDRIKEMKTRIFTIGPMDNVFVVRALTMHFTAAMYASRCKTFSSIGVNTLGPEWTTLAQNMKRRGNCNSDADYSGYDGRLDPDLIMNSLMIMYDWWEANTDVKVYQVVLDTDVITYTREQYKRALRVLACDFIHTTEIVGRVLHQKVQGNPSGNPLTVVLNTLVGYQYLVIAYLNLSISEGLRPTYQEWKEEIWLNVYGDDFTITSDELIAKWYNAEKVALFLSGYGHTLTPAQKDGQFQVVDIESLRFLKRRWRADPIFPDKYHSPIDEGTIYELTNWIRTGPDDKAQLLENLGNALREAYQHGQSFYSNLRTALNDHRDKTGMYFPDEFLMLNDEWLSQFY